MINTVETLLVPPYMNNKTSLSFIQVICLCLYYSIIRYLPENTTPLVGKLNKALRRAICKHIFLYCGKNVNIERGAYFASGKNIRIGNNSGLGVNCHIPNNTIIGDNVMMGPNCYIISNNHNYSDTSKPMIEQGLAHAEQTVIGNDVWIGRDVLMTPGRHIADGSIIAAGCVLCKDFPPFSIIGGNPSVLIKQRK